MMQGGWLASALAVGNHSWKDSQTAADRNLLEASSLLLLALGLVGMVEGNEHPTCGLTLCLGLPQSIVAKF